MMLRDELRKTLTAIGVIGAFIGFIAVTLGPPILIIWVILHFILKFW